jgi:hypothetical protein
MFFLASGASSLHTLHNAISIISKTALLSMKQTPRKGMQNYGIPQTLEESSEIY